MHLTVPTRPIAIRLQPVPRHRGFGQTATCPGAWTPRGTSSVNGQATATPPTNISQCGAGSGDPNSPTASQKTGSIVSGATSIAAGLLALSPATGPAAPFVAIAGALAAFATGVLGIGKGCGATCVDATEVANYTECVMAVNLNTYMATWPRYASMQTAAEQVFNSAWAYLQQGCGEVGGTAGNGCISQRSRGGIYDDFASFYDPIANDPCVQPDPTPVNAVTGAASTAEEALSSAASAVASAAGIAGGSSSVLMLGLIAAGLLMAMEVL